MMSLATLDGDGILDAFVIDKIDTNKVPEDKIATKRVATNGITPVPPGKAPEDIKCT